MLNTLFRPDLSNIQPIPVSQVDGWTARSTPQQISPISDRLVVDYCGVSALLRRFTTPPTGRNQRAYDL